MGFRRGRGLHARGLRGRGRPERGGGGHERLVLGQGCDIGAFTYINAAEGVEIGEHAQLGSHCSVYSLSTIDGRKGRVVIERNARVGSHTTVMPGVTIGEDFQMFPEQTTSAFVAHHPQAKYFSV